MDIIIYGSKYGTTKSYAMKLSDKTDIPIIEYSKIKSLESYNRIIYIGGLYAGGVLGLKATLKKFKLSNDQKLICITVGLADPKNEDNQNNISESLIKQIPENQIEKCQMFHLRGGIDYDKLSTSHRLMMTLLYNKVKKMPLEKQTNETQEFVKTYKKNISFVDFTTLNEIVDSI